MPLTLKEIADTIAYVLLLVVAGGFAGLYLASLPKCVSDLLDMLYGPENAGTSIETDKDIEH